MKLAATCLLTGLSALVSASSSGWIEYSGAKYLAVNAAKTWADAQADCVSKGAFLTSISSAGESQFLKSRVSAPFWAGGIGKSASTFKWIDGTPFHYTKWQAQPQSSASDVCTQVQDNTAWVASACATSQRYVCKYYTPSKVAGKRTYFLRAEEVIWDYAPNNTNVITGEPFTTDEEVYVKNEDYRIGSKYIKCLYVGYTDGTFTARSPQTREVLENGFLGPVIRAVVGDTVTVVLQSNCSIPVTLHAHGLKYDKDSEGSGYNDGTDGSADEVEAGGQKVYLWEVPERAGPASRDLSSVAWMYHSHFDEVADTNAGLMGFIIVTAKGKAHADGAPKDVDREVFSLFTVTNEQTSQYYEQNIAEFAGDRPNPLDTLEVFEESDLKHSINGWLYGNGFMVSLTERQRVRWYVMAMGTEVDLHTPHWHGNTITVNGMRMDTIALLPAQMQVVEMQPDNLGIWQYHCHVNDHLSAGMVTRYEILSKK